MNRIEYRRFRQAAIAGLGSLSAIGPSGSYDEQGLPAYTNPNRIMRSMFWQRLRVVIGILERQHHARIAVDFGAGLGLMLPILATKADEIIAIDIEPDKLIEGMNALNIEPKNFRIDVSLKDVLPSLRGKIGLILALDVLEHVDDLGGILYDLGQLLTPGGRILVSGPTENMLYRLGRRLAGYSGHYHLRNIGDVEKAISSDFRIYSRKVLFPIAPLFVIIEAGRSH